MSDAINLTLPLPPKSLHPNARKHWRRKAADAKRARQDASYAAFETRSAKPFEQATIQPTFYLPRRQDGDNLNAWLKSTIDGLQGTIIQNDSAVTVLPAKQITGRDLAHRVELEISPT